jgi:dUTP pyrophosphatase
MTKPTNPTLSLTIPIKRLVPSARIPARGSDLAAGWDLHSVEAVALPAEGWGTVRTGLAVALPAGYEMQIRPRSGLAARHGVTVLNAPGTIDADYRGELKVLLINHGTDPFEIAPGDRIAQALVTRHEVLDFRWTDALPDTDRGDGGFGHTGR